MRIHDNVSMRKARVNDVPVIGKIINNHAQKGIMLPRPVSRIYDNLRDYTVIESGSEIVGCGALHVMWSDLAEVKSVAVAEESQRQGIGDQLVEACLKEAREIGIPTVFCLTYKPAFFEKFNFSQLFNFPSGNPPGRFTTNIKSGARCDTKNIMKKSITIDELDSSSGSDWNNAGNKFSIFLNDFNIFQWCSIWFEREGMGTDNHIDKRGFEGFIFLG